MNGGSCTAMTSSETSRPLSDADEQAGDDARRQPPAAFDEQAAGDDARQRDHRAGDRSMPPEMITIAAPIAAMP